MSDAALSAQRGTTIKWRLAAIVSTTMLPYDLTAPGQTVTLTFRRRPADPVALIEKVFRSDNPGGEPGLTVPTDEATNLLDVQLAPEDTEDFTATEFLVWDVILTDQDAEKVVIAKGALTVRAGAGS